MIDIKNAIHQTIWGVICDTSQNTDAAVVAQ